MREIKVNENDGGQRVDKFLTKTLNQLPQSLMYKYIRNKKIKVNKKRCTINQRLEVGDTLQCYISEEFFDQPLDYAFLNAKNEISIVYEDDAIMVVDKPIGLLVHSDTKDDHDTLIDRILKYLYLCQSYDPKREQSFVPALVNRLDRNTCGLVVAAKNASALRELNRMIHERKVEKRYFCIVEGKMPKLKDELIMYHQKQVDNHAQIVWDYQEGYKEIKMDYHVVEEGIHHSLVEVLLHTGKSHQIRAGFAALKHPLLGDVKYGARASDWKYQALCSYSLTFYPSEDFETLSYLLGKNVCLKANPISDYFYKRCIK